MELIVEYVCVAMTTHGDSAPVVLWGCKALANAAPNGGCGPMGEAREDEYSLSLALSLYLFPVCLGDDVKLAGHCCSLLTGALEGHHDNHQIWTWCLYAILQITSRNCKSAHTHTRNCKSAHTHIHTHTFLMCGVNICKVVSIS